MDEWTLSEAMAADTANGGLSQLESHYETFIVRHYLLIRVSSSLILLIDRAGFCRNRWRWAQLCENPSAVLGH